MEETVDLPLDPALEMLLSEDPEDREFAIRIFGMRGTHLDMLATIADNDQNVAVQMLCACWLAINGDLDRFDQLAYLSTSAEDERDRMTALQLQMFAHDYRAQRRFQEQQSRSFAGRIKRLFGL